MIILMDHFASVVSDFEKFDDVHSPQDEQMVITNITMIIFYIIIGSLIINEKIVY